MSKKPIIIFRKARAHAGHHGGAWKVAYADFVTAMMALFIVLWLMNTSDHVRKVIAGYFNDPRGSSALTGSDRAGSADNLPLTRENMQQFKDRLEKAILQTEHFKALSNQIEITVTPEGLRIELLESKNGTFFDTGSTTLNQTGRDILTMLAGQLKDVPNSISIEGHTDSQPYANDAGYGNWELSTDRANAARRLMQDQGLRRNQVSQVRGYADQRLRLPKNPFDPSNRRISLIVQYLEASPPQVSGGPAKNAAPPAAPAGSIGGGGTNARPATARPANH
ncbi:MAG TPA: flagellar motor protein MotB [Silvibacterium sp.]|jgi:chemotaxis protein MotB|nr:flagellar motor protein MotB [Silvibacterium sp.]